MMLLVQAPDDGMPMTEKGNTSSPSGTKSTSLLTSSLTSDSTSTNTSTSFAGTTESTSNSCKEEKELPLPQTLLPPNENNDKPAAHVVDDEELKFKAALQNEIHTMSIPDLVEHLKGIRESKEIPRSIDVNDRNNSSHSSTDDLQSVVSKLTVPDDIASQASSTTSTNAHHHYSSGRRKRKNQLSGNPTRRNPPLSRLPPYPNYHKNDPNRARSVHMALTIGGQILTGVYSGGLVDSKPSGMGVLKFDESTNMYIGEMVDGEMHGKGTLMFEDTALRGDFEHNLFVV